MSKLIPLINGSFIRSDKVTAIRIEDLVPASDYQPYAIKDRVCIDHDKGCFVIKFDSLEECKEYAAIVAKLVEEGENE